MNTLMLCVLGWAFAAGPLAGQQNGATDPAVVRIDGLVLQQQKYSFTLRGLDRDYEVLVPNGTPLLMKLTNPGLDFENRELSVEVLVSAADGDPANNLRLTYPLPDPVYLSAAITGEQSPDRFPGQGVVHLDRFVLSSRPFPPAEQAIQGYLRPSQLPGQYKLEDDVRVIPVRLGRRKGLLADASIMDMRPNQTEVFVEGRFEAGAVVASRIRFQPLGDPFARFDPNLPNALVLGDLVSISYDRALRAALKGKMNVHHPPNTCGDSGNWRSIHRWLANPDRDRRRWDVIAFNFGLDDKSTSRSNWMSNLRNAIAALESTGATLVWVTTTPVPHGFPASAPGGPPLGLVQGRMQLQNQWAAEVLQDYPQIAVCDLWQVVQDNPDGAFDQWWSGNDLTFNVTSPVPLAGKVAESLLQASGQNLP